MITSSLRLQTPHSVSSTWRECSVLRVPIAAHKTDGPTTCLIFLGIVVDTLKGELRLPADKLQRLRDSLLEWETRKSCTRKELESLIGLLNHACKVVRAGRSFLRRMIDLLHAVHRLPNSKIPTSVSVPTSHGGRSSWFSGMGCHFSIPRHTSRA